MPPSPSEECKCGPGEPRTALLPGACRGFAGLCHAPWGRRGRRVAHPRRRAAWCRRLDGRSLLSCSARGPAELHPLCLPTPSSSNLGVPGWRTPLHEPAASGSSVAGGLLWRNRLSLLYVPGMSVLCQGTSPPRDTVWWGGGALPEQPPLTSPAPHFHAWGRFGGFPPPGHWGAGLLRHGPTETRSCRRGVRPDGSGSGNCVGMIYHRPFGFFLFFFPRSSYFGKQPKCCSAALFFPLIQGLGKLRSIVLPKHSPVLPGKPESSLSPRSGLIKALVE